ncbi:MAG TPA: Uma2 family endonuclease, partial [Tepidisphaeraceae bacterium]|nr:Uma2 family endonuclease [Tepidisphaeraceae bacterium]
ATESDLLRLVEREKRLCELIDGTLVEKPAGYVESLIAMNLAIELGAYVNQRNLGAVLGADSTMRMASGHVRLPDVAFVSTQRLPRTRQPIRQLAPDLAVQVLSQSNTNEEIQQKLRYYFESGTRLAWVIDPATRSVDVYHAPCSPTQVLHESDQLCGEQVVPGFAMAVAGLFRNVPPSGQGDAV